MKMSEFTTKSFLGNAGAAENSYILINYEDNTTQRPVTYKASLQEIGKAIANDQKLYKKTQNGAITTNVSQGAYVNTAAENFASTGAVAAAVQGLASTGYVTSAINDLVSAGYVNNEITNAVDNLASIGYVDSIKYEDPSSANNIAQAYKNYFASIGYVTSAVANAGGGGFSNPGDMPVYTNSSTGEIRWYNADNPADSDPYPVTQTNGLPLVVYDSTNGIGYFMTPSDSEMTPLDLGGATDLTNYVFASEGLSGDYILRFYDGTDSVDITPSMIGAVSTGDITDLASTGYVTDAISGLASTGDVSSALVHHLYYDIGQSTILVKNMNGTTTDFGDFASREYIAGRYASIGALAAKASTGAVTAAVNGLASTGYVTNAISGLASTGYVTAAVANTGSGGFNPISGIHCSADEYGSGDVDNLLVYPVMALNGSYPTFMIKDGQYDYLIPANLITENLASEYLRLDPENANGIKTVNGSSIISDWTTIAYIGTSDNKPAIYDGDGIFKGFLSAT